MLPVYNHPRRRPRPKTIRIPRNWWYTRITDGARRLVIQFERQKPMRYESYGFWNIDSFG